LFTSLRQLNAALDLRDFRLGITARLGIAFAAVTVLATAANLIAEHGRRFIHSTRVVAPILREPSAPPARDTLLVTATPAPVRSAPAATVEVSDNALLEALHQFVRAAEHRAVAETPDSIELLQVAQVSLGRNLRNFLGQINSRGESPRSQSLQARVAALRQGADVMIHTADQRRAVLAEYWSHFETLETQVKETLDQSNWKIFGRVIARASLVSVARDLEEVRRQSDVLSDPRADAVAVEALRHSQARFNTTLEDNTPGLTRSEGTEWLEALRREYADALASQQQLAKLDAKGPGGVAELEHAADELIRQVRAAASAASLQAQAAALPRMTDSRGPNTRTSDHRAWAHDTPAHDTSAHDTSAHDTSAPASDAAPARTPELPSVSDIAPSTAGESPSSADEAAPATHDAPLIAAISGAVLIVLLVISIATVRSIVRPIRQFMRTTARIARGDDAARFARGGIKELDDLAVAFNRMAVSLAEARAITREHQGQLESRVDERTRQLQHLAEHDPLTGLPNRRQLVAHLESSLRRAAVTGARVAVFFIDLDNFKNINDSMGHAFGDVVLNSVARRLREAAGEDGFAARLGGDEFTVVLENAGGRAEVAELGNALVRAFQTPLNVQGRELIISISGGASIYPDHERDADALLRAADAALFRAKQAGRARLSLFSPELLEAASLKFSLEQGLRRALERGELELWYQPEVSLTSLDTRLVEALLRWRLPDGQYVMPAEFLPVAEDSGLIRSINDWVLLTACRQVAEWHGAGWPQARVAINVSAHQLLDSGFVVRLSELLAQYRIPARSIEIELTETVLQTEAATIEVLRELRRLEVSVALDDFGSGYSSVTSLERLPLTRVKLDRSLIDSIDTSARSLAIARAIIGLCQNLGLEVTAEGVERSEQLALLLAHPGITLQGYLLAHPIEAEAVPDTLAGLRSRMESLLLTVPVARDAPTVATRDAQEIRKVARAAAE
jgi:diguanylate cyclase (GGDEF)-like protein